jgi:hypothetical protein
MKLDETFGFERVHGRGTINSPQHTKVGQQPREGRPNSKKIKKRPNKNLWFQDDKLWKADLDLEHGGNYTLVTDENEEKVVACDGEKKWAHGFWDKKKGRGITYKAPRPMTMVVHPKTTFKDFVVQ